MEETKYHGKYLKVTEEHIDGTTWERVYLQDGVQVFPITDDKKVILIEERRPHERNPIRLKFVTGILEAGENPLDTANREMQEEIGQTAKHLEILIHRETSGTVNNNFYQVIARGLSPFKLPNPDGEDTIVSIKEFSLKELEALLSSGELPWSMGALGIFKLKQEGLL
jgi:8-oxo-dGTP pyrophosphatase MutT (NUDIX family)